MLAVRWRFTLLNDLSLVERLLCAAGEPINEVPGRAAIIGAASEIRHRHF
jgi:hypothetical protein